MADNFDNYSMKVQARVDMPRNKDIDAQIRKLEKSISKLKISGQFDDTALKNLTNQLNSLKATISTANFSPIALTELTNQVNKALQNINIGNINVGNVGSQAQQLGQQIGQQINQGASQSLNGNDGVLDSFKRSLKNIGMGSEEIDAVASRINNIGVQIESLNQTTSHSVGKHGDKDILSVDISGVDKLGQAIKLTEQYNMATGDLIKSMDSVSTVQQKVGINTNTFAKQQSQAVANLTNQINQLNRAANDQNTSRPITDSSHLNSLSTVYDEIISAIDRMKNASNDTFVEEQNNVKTLISDYKSLVSEFRNAENVSTKMKGTDLSSGLSIARNDLEKFKADAKDFPQIIQTINNLDSAISNVGDASSLNSFNDQLRVARSELAKIKSETNATNRNEKVGINVSGLQSQITDLQRISPEIDKFEANINGAKVTVQSLLTDLSNVNTQSDFSVVNSKWKAFTDSAKSAGIAITEVGIRSESIIDKVNNKTYDKQFASLEQSYRNLGLSSDEVKNKTNEVSVALDKLKRKNLDTLTQDEKEFVDALKKAQNEASILKTDLESIYNPNKQFKLSTDIQNWLSKNSAASKSAKQSLQEYYQELSNGRVSVDRLNYIEQELKSIDAQQRGLGKLGKNLKDQFSQAAESFGQWLSVSSGIMFLISQTKSTISEIKELDNTLTEISKTSDMTSQELKELGLAAYDTASKYGKTASDYLSGVQSMSQSGFYGEQGEAMAEQSLLAQAAGDMSQEIADKYVLATNAAYKFNGEAEKLNTVLDGQNSISNRNSVALEDMALAMSEAGTVASSYNVSIENLSAMIGTMEAVTKSGGSEVGNALKSILINLQNVTSDKIVGTLDKANASMTEMVNGAEKLRNPIEILRDLAKTFNTLDEDDPLRAEILTNVAGKYQATKLAALLQNIDMLDKMLVDYSEGSGSAMEEANKSAENLTGRLNALSNSWTEFVNNVVSSDELKTGVSIFNALVQGATEFVDVLGLIPIAISAIYTVTKKSGGLIRLIHSINNSPFLATVEFNSDVYDSYIYV